MLKDPVCGKRIHRDRAHARIIHERVAYYVCCPLCQAAFQEAPDRYARPEVGERAVATPGDRTVRPQHSH